MSPDRHGEEISYSGSARQRRRQRRLRLIALVAALSMLVPILVTTVDAVSG